jgi:DNA topoisomerase-1
VTKFKTEAAYKVTALFNVPDGDGKNVLLKADLDQRLKTKAEAEAFLEKCKNATFTIDNIAVRPAKKSPAAPFTTSTLQQEAARKLGYTVSQTMVLAQRLYEAGLITYMRTDSVNLSEYAIAGCHNTITKMLGAEYAQTRHFTTKTKGAQEAHEAIRPTYMENENVSAPAQEKRLYNLIWKRTLASQMADAELEKTTVTIAIDGGKDTFTAVGEVVKFDGFLHIYMESADDDIEQDDEGMLPPLTQGEKLTYNSIAATERFTQRPPRYTEASLVKKLEELGIGRPSTYAPTISTIQQREYVVKGDKPGEERNYDVLTLRGGKLSDETRKETIGYEKSKLLPTDIGIVVNDFLTEYFPNILDYNFTANIEKEFDEIADGEKQWDSTMKEFYTGFHPSVESTLALKSEHKVGERVLGTEPKTGEQVAVKIGRFGPMIQIGSNNENGEKPRFARLPKELSMETVTLEEALELFKLPRKLGEFEGEEMVVSAGRFGPYVKHGAKYYSLAKGMDPMEITADEAIKLIADKREADEKKFIKRFDEDPEMLIMNGRYGPYISYQKKNYKIPSGIEPADLSLQSCHDLIKLQNDKAESAPKKRRYAKKA